jgi:transcription factor C subunit 7
LVTHAATAIVLARGLVGDREIPLKVGCCSLTELNFKPNQAEERKEKGLLGAYHPVKLADGAHLKGGALREWGFDDVEVEKGRVCSHLSSSVLGGLQEFDRSSKIQENLARRPKRIFRSVLRPISLAISRIYPGILAIRVL